MYKSVEAFGKALKEGTVPDGLTVMLDNDSVSASTNDDDEVFEMDVDPRTFLAELLTSFGVQTDDL